MRHEEEPLSPAPVDRVRDTPRILRAITRAVRQALTRHKKLGNPVAIWREGKVVWIPPEEIPDWEDEPEADENGRPPPA